ncbi:MULTISPECIES: sigma-54-dependent transcriptional regulator [Methylosinus]|uniref:Sigma-54-dependent Fis family transcriptional regulator n=1 Tax=Methylosinus trichosporium (strain ATCC 35070 / NCIMB 11131 / UNIQEM 75 / OB3b) TaxID=595536 RepID=A0A2D2CWB6_METT3|nr:MULTISPECIES: sigma-54 dependent transcriptional regulator [Methylosinus]ATQ67071.1 sigma-54-dependent Fis family transcriptional regulator [Methylosinus trichosporium OB3b]OBS51093.1 sigma-54-dependent Fis family transcriptional regulator [Methylosinus sp. 3S-1]
MNEREDPAKLDCDKRRSATGATVLIVDDERRSLESLKRVLGVEFQILCAQNAAEAEAILDGDLVQVVLCDQRMPGETGVEFLTRVRERWPEPVRMIISGYSDAEDIIAGVNEAGVYRYVTKPWDPDRLLETVREAARLYAAQKEGGAAPPLDAKPSNERLRRIVQDKRRAERRMFEFSRIAHAPDSPMRQTIALARRAAEYDISVLITGASGTGKELLARAIHHGSARGEKSFVLENCGALPDELLESELFGCKKGAFTGAYQDRVGLFEVADGGSIFLDEIGETSPSFQVKLLRVLQEGEIRPLGAQRPRRVDVRVIAATNRDIKAEVEAGRFRRDLYYRLAAFPIHLSALNERRGDIAIIAARILLAVNQQFNRRIPGFEPETLRLMERYSWPGNVREMHNEIQRMVVLSDGEANLSPELLSPAILDHGRPAAQQEGQTRFTLKERVEMLECALIKESLERNGRNISHVADELGLSRVGLRSKIARYDISRVVDDEA